MGEGVRGEGGGRGGGKAYLGVKEGKGSNVPDQQGPPCCLVDRADATPWLSPSFLPCLPSKTVSFLRAGLALSAPCVSLVVLSSVLP